jgi:hypothetical protein
MSYGIGLVPANLASRFVANEELTQANRSRLFPGDDFKIIEDTQMAAPVVVSVTSIDKGCVVFMDDHLSDYLFGRFFL